MAFKESVKLLLFVCVYASGSAWVAVAGGLRLSRERRSKDAACMLQGMSGLLINWEAGGLFFLLT